MVDKQIHGWRAVPRSVLALGLVALFMDISSELIHSLLPLFLVGTLGASVATVGVIEGLAEATASVARLFSGAISDRIGKRKILAVVGYGLSALSKPIFPLAGSIGAVLGARFVDRVGKGIRSAPRDALVADITPPAIRGAAFGIRQALDTVGAFAGPLLAIGLMIVYAGDFRVVFWWAVLPAVIAMLLMIFGVQEPAGGKPSRKRGWPIQRADLARLTAAYWWVLAIGVVFTLARFSEAFLVLKGNETGLPIAMTPLVMVVMNIVYAAVATPAGTLSDRIGRRRMLGFGLAALIAADLVLMLMPGLVGLFVGVALWGIYMGATQGLLSALVADVAPANLRGTAFGLFNLATGFALLAASSLAGVLWQKFGSTATFGTGAALAALAGMVLLASGGRHGAKGLRSLAM